MDESAAHPGLRKLHRFELISGILGNVDIGYPRNDLNARNRVGLGKVRIRNAEKGIDIQ